MPKRNQISQAEARRLRLENQILRNERDEQRRRWARTYPGGVNIATTNHGDATNFLPAVVHTSMALGHAVVCVADGGTIRYYALPLPGGRGG